MENKKNSKSMPEDKTFASNLEERIIEYVKKGPSSITDIANETGKARQQIGKKVDEMINKKNPLIVDKRVGKRRMVTTPDKAYLLGSGDHKEPVGFDNIIQFVTDECTNLVHDMATIQNESTPGLFERARSLYGAIRVIEEDQDRCFRRPWLQWYNSAENKQVKIPESGKPADEILEMDMWVLEKASSVFQCRNLALWMQFISGVLNSLKTK